MTGTTADTTTRIAVARRCRAEHLTRAAHSSTATAAMAIDRRSTEHLTVTPTATSTAAAVSNGLARVGRAAAAAGASSSRRRRQAKATVVVVVVASTANTQV